MNSYRLTRGPPLPPPVSIRGSFQTRSPADDIIQKWNLAEEMNRDRRYRYESERYRRVIMSERTLEMRRTELTAIFGGLSVEKREEKTKGTIILEDITNRNAAIALNPLPEPKGADVDPEKKFHMTPNYGQDKSQKWGDMIVEDPIDGKSTVSQARHRETFIAWASRLPRDKNSDEEALDKEEAAEKSDMQSRSSPRVEGDLDNSSELDEVEEIVLVSLSIQTSENGDNELY